MAFDINDTFTGNGGSSKVGNTWVPSVYKFDSSSFYNWEQDNLPIYDLETRTQFNFERMGFPTSSIPGISYVLSGSNPNSVQNVFTVISDLVNAIPEVISFPMQIEIATFGALSSLNLNNIKITKNGVLEIINRCYGRTVQASAIVNGLVTVDGQIFVSAVSSLDLKNTLLNTSTVSLGTTILSGAGDGSYNTTNRIFVSKPGGQKTDRMTVVVNSAGLTTVANNIFTFNAGSVFGSTQDASVTTGDVLPVYGIDGITEIKRTNAAISDAVEILVYGNYFNSIKIENCDGPIYLRGLCVDGGDVNVHTTNNGFEINNSNVIIENCASMRSTESGYKATNSKVIFSRGVIGYRNYALSASVRPSLDEGAGVKLVNTELNLSSNTNYAQNDDILLAFSRNGVGLDAYNSVIGGGFSRSSSSVLGSTLWLQSYYNNKIGIRGNSSIFKFNGRPDVFCNNVGIIGVNSNFNLQEFGIDRQKSFGLSLNNSHLIYNSNLSSFAPSITDFQQFYLDRNGQNIVARNSTILPTKTTNMPSVYGRFYSVSSHAISPGDNSGSIKHLLPGIDVYGTQAEFVHLNGATLEYTGAAPRGYDGPIYGAAISAKRNSNIICRGSGLYATFIIGPGTISTQQYNAGVFISGESEIEFTGPTKVAQFGVDCLAENNSTIFINPPRLDSGSVDVSGWNLVDTTNHTKAEFHSTRACIVLNHNSILDAKDLGDFTTHWGSNPDVAISDMSKNSYSNASYVSAGFLQFYPNPQNTILAFATVTNPLQIGTSTLGAQSAISEGGVCVRAVTDSLVNLHNVNFPMGFGNVSGIHYDSTDNFEQLFIWNIADTSKLRAAYLSVSGLYPSGAGYDGPSSVYSSGAGVVAYGAPAGTPDSSSQSILDLFGGSSIVRPGASKSNYGPFRIYLSPFTLAKSLNYTTSALGLVYQSFAQGYNPSATLVAIADDTIYGAASTLSGFYYASAMLDSTIGRIFLDESAANTFANAKHLSLNKSGTGRQIMIYKAKNNRGGEGLDSEGADGGGFYSANIFELGRIN
jgi:hypothetical protein